MAEDVRPLREDERVWLKSLNGIGCRLMGFSRTDGSGRYFGTRWVTVVGMPLIPLDRYYLRQESNQVLGAPGFSSTELTTYQISGKAEINGVEILRTLAFCWLLIPAIVIGPAVLIVALNWSDESPGFIGIAGPFIWLVLSGVIVALRLEKYRKTKAPVHAVRWVTKLSYDP